MGPIFANFSGLVELWLQMISLKLVVLSVNGRCYGNSHPGPRLPSQPQVVSALWPVPIYTAW